MLTHVRVLRDGGDPAVAADVRDLVVTGLANNITYGPVAEVWWPLDGTCLVRLTDGRVLGRWRGGRFRGGRAELPYRAVPEQLPELRERARRELGLREAPGGPT